MAFNQVGTIFISLSMNDVLSLCLCTLEFCSLNEPLKPYLTMKGTICFSWKSLYSSFHHFDQCFVPFSTLLEDYGFIFAKSMHFEADFKVPVEGIPYALIIDEFCIESKMVIGLHRIKRQGWWEVFKEMLEMMDS